MLVLPSTILVCLFLFFSSYFILFLEFIYNIMHQFNSEYDRIKFEFKAFVETLYKSMI